MDAFREPRIRRAGRQAVTLARAVRAGRARARAAPAAPRVDGAALRDLVAEVAEDARVVEVPVDRPPWTGTGLRVEEGEQATWLAWGEGHLPLGVGLRPHHLVRCRVGGGPLQASARDGFTFTADRTGPVELASIFPGEPRDDGSVVTDRIPYRAIRGGLTAVVARWAGDADVRGALASVADRDPSALCAAEAERLADPPAPPPGWEDHPLLWPEEVYAPDGGGIVVDARETASIVRKPAEAALTPTLRLRWSWRLDELPSELPEDTTFTHDYLSVALEFDDGQDLTWHWSSSLPVGFAYRCPLAHWRHRETHIVARSGTEALGRWVDEERPVLADHQVAIGGPAPKRVVRAWLISVSVFQRGRALGELGRIELVDGDQVMRVL